MKQVLLGRPELVTGEIMHAVLTEIKLMSALGHKCVVEFLGVASPYPNEIYLLTELMSRGSLDAVLEQKKGNLPVNIRMRILKDTAKGMMYLHSRKIIHRDLKPANLLVSRDWRCKIADFDTVRPGMTKTMTVIGTPVYMAPEVLLNEKYTQSCDVYSFGIVMVEMLTGRKPYSEHGLMQAQLMYKICNDGLLPSCEGIPHSLQLLIQDCLARKPSLRPSFVEVLLRLKRLMRDPSVASYQVDDYTSSTLSVRSYASSSSTSHTRRAGDTQELIAREMHLSINDGDACAVAFDSGEPVHVEIIGEKTHKHEEP
eukprot:CAMPEP_0114619222 /NCGR_PEP_ID=MMETSP0168-20121206/8104_1 /TAXON_ID=95228 ORGANISM="Vannella sp., Strain DIVA3 517/6/12" /NCGR_SAMPLE_ID=MMETSP0168 /ASSEMBLY_ACC=CAM_ASM_000044 /LENGTH=312 /DNA_ID=CAMNT_0001830387 /DNA_START=30 /DNA_END=964 /DNA_ORIENTATION=+